MVNGTKFYTMICISKSRLSSQKYGSVCVYVCVCALFAQSCPHGLQPVKLLCPWDFPGKNTGVSYHAFLQGIFQTQGVELRSPTLQVDSLPPKPPKCCVNSQKSRNYINLQNGFFFFQIVTANFYKIFQRISVQHTDVQPFCGTTCAGKPSAMKTLPCSL